MREKQIELNINDNYRIIAISDIHGHLDLFKRLLGKLNLVADDHLIIIGDMINKGPDSLGTLRYMMELSNRANTYILKGNHEHFICDVLFNNNLDDNFLTFLKEHHYETLIHSTANSLGFNINQCHEPNALIQWQLTHFKREYNFINSLPSILLADEFIFVHGGYESTFCPNNDESKYLKYDNFNDLSPRHDKTIVVGHWPTSNLRTHINTNLPFHNNEKHIISIDGGLGVKPSGELNALIINKTQGQLQYSYLQENHFKRVAIIKEHTFNTEDRYFINYPHFDIEVVEKGDFVTKCRHIQSGKTLSIFNSLLRYRQGKPELITTYINHFLNLSIGEIVELVMTYEDCCLIKHNNEFGWIHSWQVDSQT